jgi:hypothetical protein
MSAIETGLIIIDRSGLTVNTTPLALEMRDNALAQSGLIGKVTNGDENNLAAMAQVELKRVLKLVEDDRKEVKGPVIDLGKAIDAKAKELVRDVDQEFNRISKLVADFQALENAKARAIEAQRVAELSRIERETQAAIAQATSHEEIENIRAEADQKAAEKSVELAPPPHKLSHQIVGEGWDFEVTDMWTLARAHPSCVNIEPRRAEIKSLLNVGVKVAGVRAWKQTKATVRL